MITALVSFNLVSKTSADSYYFFLVVFVIYFGDFRFDGFGCFEERTTV